MAKKKKGGAPSKGAQQRTRTHPATGAVEVVGGTKAGKKRSRLPVGHPLRTHDLGAVVHEKKK